MDVQYISWGNTFVSILFCFWYSERVATQTLTQISSLPFSFLQRDARVSSWTVASVFSSAVLSLTTTCITRPLWTWASNVLLQGGYMVGRFCLYTWPFSTDTHPHTKSESNTTENLTGLSFKSISKTIHYVFHSIMTGFTGSETNTYWNDTMLWLCDIVNWQLLLQEKHTYIEPFKWNHAILVECRHKVNILTLFLPFYSWSYDARVNVRKKMCLCNCSLLAPPLKLPLFTIHQIQ